MTTSSPPPAPLLPDYIKHILECKCILPQYRTQDPPVFHRFLAFSVLDPAGGGSVLVPSYCQCPNCGVIHKITEVGHSRIMKKEQMPSLIGIEDLKLGLPPKLVGILELHDCPLATWQEADFILKNKLWGKGFVLAKELDGSTTLGKYIVILGEQLYDIKAFEREEGLI